MENINETISFRYMKMEYSIRTGFKDIDMVCIFDSEKLTEKEVKYLIDTDEYSPYACKMTLKQYNAVIRPAVYEFFINESNTKYKIAVGDEFYFYDAKNSEPPEKCIVDMIKKDEKTDEVLSYGIQFFNNENKKTDYEVFVPNVTQVLFLTLEDIHYNHPIAKQM